MTEGDLDEIVAIEESTFPTPWSKEVFARELLIPISRCIVARVQAGQGDVGGYLVYWVAAGELEVHKICVKGDLRRRGIGSLLMIHMICLAIREGVTLCTLEVGRSNLGAKKLYEKFCFEVTDVRPKYYTESGDDAMVMCADMARLLEFVGRMGCRISDER
ncbi:MAG TPA: ribosomal protein S18-alanine N-acetyltransferase [Syntrophales bacterium]|nr:ribosomal protein S18-alanine N-acetyltransferase [Syntrophales bacterium]